MRARQRYIRATGSHERISFQWETVVEAIEGDSQVRQLRLVNTADNV